ncbi:hypothetical protein [Pelagibaculum spongiae]|uniref:Lactate permease n=1 Tax=Pelagibaculum spongiae TaxID=2080658 RepID=A0A2V1GYI5_9GAMM|nr:hypothetical protein [Pelagibaculum spongiae]PVZ70397.1 hypothetical protein DC094_07330 [Pelagibaculum spongiae]
MSSRLDRYKKQKQIIEASRKKKFIKELPTPNEVTELLSQKVDFESINNTLLDDLPVYNLEVSEKEISDSLKELDKQFNKEKYDILFQSSKEVLIDQLLTPLKLSRSDLESTDRNFNYDRNEYTKSPKSVGGEGDSFTTQRDKLKRSQTNSAGEIQDTYTGKSHNEKEMDLDHVKSLKDFHDDGGYMLSDAEKRQFAADSGNHEFTHSSINRSKGEKDLNEFAQNNDNIDKRRTNAAHDRASKTSEKYVPQGNIDKTIFIAKKGAQDGVKSGAHQGMQHGVASILSELISSVFYEVQDIFNNGWKGGKYNNSWIDALKERLSRIKDKILSKWKTFVKSFADGAFSGFISSIFTAILNMFIRTGSNIVRIIRESFLSLTKALKVLLSPPDGMTTRQAAHEASKVLATGIVITGGVIAGEALSTLLNGIPFSDIISMVLTGMLSGLGSLLVVFLLDKLDLFGINKSERHNFIIGTLDSKISSHTEEMEKIIDDLGLSYDG